ncbi:MAG: branched-chain amino acid ABC transporter ATP-binding protein, partial [Proteobacteria bacterium]|nr:branched-chain amino acid ABC transporter ATP-binding protein [Pseudomonadota bacterium]
QQMLAIGRALMSRPRLLLVDEPSLGLAPIVIDQIYSVITRLKDEGRTILLVEENISRASEIADFIHLLDNGSFVWQGPPEELQLHQEILETYLGG